MKTIQVGIRLTPQELQLVDAVLVKWSNKFLGKRVSRADVIRHFFLRGIEEENIRPIFTVVNENDGDS